MKKIPEAPQWIINLLLIGAIMMILSTLGHAQEVRVEKVPAHELGDSLWGQTLCDSTGNPTIKILDELQGDELNKVLLHEATHVLQMRGDCRKSLKRYANDPRFAFEEELEATCVELQIFPPTGVNGKLVELDKLSIFLWTDHQADFTDYTVMKARVAEVCGKKSPNTPKVKITAVMFKIEHDSS